MKKGSVKSDIGIILQMYRQNIGVVVRIFLLLTLIAGCNVVLPQLTASIIDNGLAVGDVDLTRRLAVALFGISALIAVVYLRCEHLRLTGYNKATEQLRHQALNKLFRVKINFFDERSATELFAQLDEDIQAVSGCFGTEIFMALMQTFTVLGLFPVLCSVSWQLTVCMLLFLPFKLLKTLLLSKRGYRNAKRMIQAKKEYGKWLAEVVSGMPVIRLFEAQRHFDDAFYIKQHDVMETRYRHEMFQEFDAQSESMFMSLLDNFFYVLACYLIVGNSLSLGEFISFQCYSAILIGFIGRFTGIIFEFSAIMPSLDRFREFLAEKEETHLDAAAMPSAFDIDFCHVDFSYSNGQRVFRGFDMHIPQGEHAAIVGPNGSGKSTVVALLLRFYEPDAGQITIGGIEINSLPLEAYRRLFAVVPQKPYLFCDSIYNNLTMFHDVADSRLKDVIHRIGLEEFIREKGLEYCVGQNGCELSGGQRQLIGLGRALLLDAPIIILDEAEANVDQAYEGILTRLLQDAFDQKTVIMITHRKELLAHIDNVIYLYDEPDRTVKA